MPDSPSALIAGIQNKIALLSERRDRAESRCLELEKQIADLSATIRDKDQQLNEARLEIEFLTLSHRLADSPEALANARNTISRIIRKVDSAIALIKSDPADL
ncbi:MAG: hypothetical protein K2J15_05130 [Muribaculaceae bacterium]|nr:hypothetical protein [Muribaculaceae bacterium]